MKERCIEIEKLQNEGDSFGIHKKVEEVAGTYNKKHVSPLTNGNVHLVTDGSEIKGFGRNMLTSASMIKERIKWAFCK